MPVPLAAPIVAIRSPERNTRPHSGEPRCDGRAAPDSRGVLTGNLQVLEEIETIFSFIPSKGACLPLTRDRTSSRERWRCSS